MLYEISLRIARGSYELETVYFGNGIIQIENGIIEGIIARDYVTGSISEKRIEISTFDVDFYGSHEFSVLCFSTISTSSRALVSKEYFSLITGHCSSTFAFTSS